MADEGRKGTYSSTLADRKSKRLESALSSYSSEETKKAVGRLLEAYMDEGGKNYFGAGRRDTTLYFADDEYIKEVDKVKSSKPHKSENIKSSVHSAEDISEAKEAQPEKTVDEKDTAPVISSEPTIVIDPSQIRSAEKAEMAEAEENAVEESNKSTEEEASEMKYNDEFEQDAEEEIVPRRRRSAAKKPEPEVEEEYEEEEEYEDDDEYDDDDEYYDDDDEYEEKKGGLFSVFRKKQKDEEYDDDDEYEDIDEYDDEYDEYDDDEYDDEEGAVSVRKIFNIILVVLLICAVAVLAAMCYSYKNNYDSARQQIEQLQGEGGTSTAEQINELKAQVEQLKAENEQLKSGTVAPAENTENSSTVSGGTQSTGSIQTADGAPSSVVDDTSGATSSNSGSTYVVQAGDNTGVKLCTNVYGEYTPELWDKLCQANGKSGADFVVGEEIIVP